MAQPDNQAEYQTLIVERRGGAGLIILNRPGALNALNSTVARELLAALRAFDAAEDVGAIVIAGSEKAFAAGADIREMQSIDAASAIVGDLYGEWEEFGRIRKPVIAAVSGYALGGGCELAMMCDIILAADNARFGQPEITLGIMPGMGGTQRLVRAIGKSKAMEMCLTGRLMGAEEAERAGLVARVVPANELLDSALTLAQAIAGMSRPAAMMVKEAINRAFETPLCEGLRFERRSFHATFATEDQSEGMAAFVDKRKPQFQNR